MPKYSVIIPVYNVEAYLTDCLESVLAQDTAADFEIILVDDGSPDGSGAICDDYAARYPRIRVIHSENHGVSHARNLGLAAAAGTYVLFLDADDLWKAGLLSALDKLTEGNPDMAVFGNSRLLESGEEIPVPVDKVIPAGERGAVYLQALFARGAVPRAYPWCYAFRRNLLEEKQLRFPEDMKVSEDFVFAFSCLGAAESIRGTQERLYLYRCRSGSATASLSPQKLMDNLTSKARFYRLYPTAAMANLYGDNALLVSRLSKAEAGEALAFLRENRDIWDHVSQAPLKLGRVLTGLFGDYHGAGIYTIIRGFGRKLRGRE